MIKKNIWGRDFDLDVIYHSYKNQSLTSEQEEVKGSISQFDFQNDESLEMVKNYCLKRNKEDIIDGTIDNIFKYVVPESIFVTRDGKVALLCRYRYDIEHGIAVIYKNDNSIVVDQQDILF